MTHVLSAICVRIIPFYFKFVGKFRDQKRSDLASKTVLKEEASVSKDAKRALKEEAEAPEKEALDNIRAEEEKQKQAREEQEKKEKEEKANTFFQKLDLDQVMKWLLKDIFSTLAIATQTLNSRINGNKAKIFLIF